MIFIFLIISFVFTLGKENNSQQESFFQLGVELFNKGKWLEAKDNFDKLKLMQLNRDYRTKITKYKVYCLHQLNLMPDAANEAILAFKEDVEDEWDINGRYEI